MNKVKTIKVKNEDGSISEESYSIAADAVNVDMVNGKNVQETIGTIDVDKDGDIATQLNKKINKSDIIDNLDSSDNNKVLSAKQGKVLNEAVAAANSDIKKKIYYFNTVAEMKSANLKENDVCQTLGYYEESDGEVELYKIINDNTLVADNNSIIQLNNGMYAIKINQTRDYLLSQLLKNKQNKKKPYWLNTNYIYAVTYTPGTGENPFLAVSRNGLDWDKVFTLSNDAFVQESIISGRAVYDISTIVHDGYFYMAYDYIDTTYNNYNQLNHNYFLGGNRIGVSRTKDFINWESWNLDIDLTWKQTWAPEFFIDNGNCYIAISLANGIDTKNNIATPSQIDYVKDTYLLKMNNNFRNIENYTKILDINNVTIDPFIFKENNLYYLVVKDETNKNIMIYRSNNLLSFTEKISTITYYAKDTNLKYIEGASVIKIDNLYYMYTDTENKGHKTLLWFSEDLITWSNPNIITVPQEMQHFTAKITDSSIRNLLNKAYNQYDYPNNYIEKIYPQSENEYDTTNYTLSYFVPIPGASYIILGSDEVTIQPKNKMFYGALKNATINISSQRATAVPIHIKLGSQTIDLCGRDSVDVGFYWEDSAAFPARGYKYTKFGKITVSNYVANTQYSQTITLENVSRITSVVVTPVLGPLALNVNNITNVTVSDITSNTFKINMISNKNFDTLDINYICI